MWSREPWGPKRVKTMLVIILRCCFPLSFSHEGLDPSSVVMYDGIVALITHEMSTMYFCVLKFLSSNFKYVK